MTLFLNMIAAAAMLFASSGWETITIYWNDISPEEQAETLRSSYVPSHVRSYYNRTTAPADDQATVDVLNTVSNITAPWQKRALYLHVFDRILNNAEGSLSDKMGAYCVKIIKSDPEFVMYYIHENDRARMRFTNALSHAFWKGNAGISMEQFKSSVYGKLRSNPDLGDTLRKFFGDIEFATFELRHNN